MKKESKKRFQQSKHAREGAIELRQEAVSWLGHSESPEETEWSKERSMYRDALKMISKELEDQKKVSEDLRKRLLMLESKSAKEEKKAAETARVFHTKSNSNGKVEQIHLKLPIGCHKAKGSLDDYLIKKTEYKKRRSKKVPGSASYGGYGKLFSSGESQNSANIATSRAINYETSSNKVSIKGCTTSRPSAIRPNVGAGTKVPLTEASSQSISSVQTTLPPSHPRTVIQDQLYSKMEDSTHVSVDYLADSTLTAIHQENLSDANQSGSVQDSEINITQMEDSKSVCLDKTSPLSLTTSEIPLTDSISFLSEKCVLRAHMDGVRDVQFSSALNYMMTVSEDCMVKLWDIKNLKKSNALHSGKIEPCFTYRGHTGPLFSCCVGSGMQKEDHFLYSAGSEGIIRIWGIPPYESSKYPATNGKNYCVGLWTSHRDVVWQLVHHSKEPLLLSVSADGTVKMWKEFDLEEYTDNVDKNSNDCLLGAFVLKSPSKQYYEVPTSAAWIPSLTNALLQKLIITTSLTNSLTNFFE